MSSSTLLAVLPSLILVPLLPLALAFLFLVFIFPSPPSSTYTPSTHDQRLSFYDDQKTLRPSTPTPPPTPSPKGIVAILGPALGSALVFGAAATCGYASAERGEDATGPLSRLAGVLLVLGTALGKSTGSKCE